MVATKRCSVCGEEKRLVEFSRHRRYPDGLQYECKSCRAEQKVAYRAANREQISARAAAHYAENREKIAARRAVYRAAQPEKIAAQKAAYRAKNREKTAASDAMYRARNRERRAAQQKNRNARKNGNGGTHSAEDIRAQYARQKGRCFWCKAKVGAKYHVDHVTPLSKGGSNGPENLVIACPTCNLSKHDKHPMDFAGVLL